MTPVNSPKATIKELNHPLGYITEYFGFEYIEPFKIVLVDNKRCMSALVLKKV
jgi:hypothetical protein